MSDVTLSLEQIEAQLVETYRRGEVGQVALLCWIAEARYPGAASSKIYARKILREPSVASLTLEQFKAGSKSLRQREDWDQVARFAALGLLRYPSERYLILTLIEALNQFDYHDLIQVALDQLGEPSDDDIVLLNARAAHAHNRKDYTTALGYFQKIHALEPDNEQIICNLSASLVGLERQAEAIALLEEHLGESEEPRDFIHRLTALYRSVESDVKAELTRLDTRYFASCETRGRARAHADIQMFLQDVRGVETGLSKMLEFSWDPKVAFELAEAKLALGDFDDALRLYNVRFDAFPHLKWTSPSGKRYQGEQLDRETLFVWGEQGLGDELLFSFFFDELSHRVQNVTAAIEPRLIPYFQVRFPHWKFLNRHDCADQIPVTDYACPSGDLMILFLQEMLAAGTEFPRPFIQADSGRAAEIRAALKGKPKPRIAISWRGGSGANGKIRSMELSQLVAGLPDGFDIELISLQYDGEHQKEVVEHGDRRIALSGLNNREDLEGVFALMSCCDAVLTVDNSVAHFAGILGIPAFVLVPAGQVQFRWKNPQLRELFFPAAELFVQEKPGEWDAVVTHAWQRMAAALSWSNF